MESLSSRQAAMRALTNALQEFCVRQIKYDLPPLTVRNVPIALMSHEWQSYYEVCLGPRCCCSRRHLFVFLECGASKISFHSIFRADKRTNALCCLLSRQVCTLVVLNLVTSECEGADSLLGPGNGKYAQKAINNLVCYSLECFVCGSTKQCGGMFFCFGCVRGVGGGGFRFECTLETDAQH
jgi:hypothetical protein